MTRLKNEHWTIDKIKIKRNIINFSNHNRMSFPIYWHSWNYCQKFLLLSFSTTLFPRPPFYLSNYLLLLFILFSFWNWFSSQFSRLCKRPFYLFNFIFLERYIWFLQFWIKKFESFLKNSFIGIFHLDLEEHW